MVVDSDDDHDGCDGNADDGYVRVVVIHPLADASAYPGSDQEHVPEAPVHFSILVGP